MRTPARSRSYFHFRRGGRNQGAKPLSVLIWISAARYWPAPAATIRSLHAVLPSAGRLGCVDRHVWELQVACFVRLLGPDIWMLAGVAKWFAITGQVISGSLLFVRLRQMHRFRDGMSHPRDSAAGADAPSRLGPGGRIPPAVTGATFVTGRVETLHLL